MTIDPNPKQSADTNRDDGSSVASAESNVNARPLRLLRRRQVEELIGLKRAAIYALQRSGQFPRSVKITERAVGWIEEEIQRWLQERSRGRKP